MASANITVTKDIFNHSQLADAAKFAEELLRVESEDPYATFTLRNEAGYLLGVVTNRRIMGKFHKQQWGGPRGNDALHIGTEVFDATDFILLMEYSDILEIENQGELSDEIGRAHIDWAGPCYVHVAEEICAYFGVNELAEITPEALNFARQRANPKPAVEEVITLNVKLRLRVVPGAIVSDFIENLDYSVVSKTEGITVRDTEIVGHD